MQRSENQKLQIEVYDITVGSSRIVDITPSRDWPGDGLLGIVIRLEQYETDGEVVKPQVGSFELIALAYLIIEGGYRCEL